MTTKLRARRDELAKDVSVNDSYVLKEAPYQRDERLFCEGFDAAVAELWPVVEALKKAANNVTWFDKSKDGNDVLYTYGYHVEECQKAISSVGVGESE